MILEMFIAIGRVDGAVEVWDGMGKRGFRCYDPWATLQQGCNKGTAEEACSYFLRLVDEGIPPYQATCQVAQAWLAR
jgi:heat shock factor-binding protein 1